MKYLIIALLLSANMFALSQNKIESFMSTNINNVVQMLKIGRENNVSKDKLSEEIFKIFDSVFDYRLMARLSIGSRVWGTLSKTQQERFTTLFTNRLKESYKSKLDMYNGQKITVNGIQKIKSNRIHLLSEIKGKKEKYDIVYKFYKSKNNQWYIYDVSVLGVSIIQTYRSQFSDELKKMSFDKLLKKLDKQS
ncbi:MAG: ABC transporter substrate-binding protein [Sulfurospirillum sp.]